jgi:hypothetical protein
MMDSPSLSFNFVFPSSVGVLDRIFVSLITRTARDLRLFSAVFETDGGAVGSREALFVICLSY